MSNLRLDQPARKGLGGLVSLMTFKVVSSLMGESGERKRMAFPEGHNLI